MAIFSKWKFLALVLVIPVVVLVALACGDDDDDDGSAEVDAVAALCVDLASLQAADAAFDDLGPTSTIDEVEAAGDAYKDALDDVRSSAQDVVDVRTEPIQDAYADLDAAIDDIPGDATVAEGLASIQDELVAVDAAFIEAFSGVDCG